MYMKKKTKRKILVGRIISVFLILLSIIFMYVIKTCDILPFKYLALLFLVLGFFVSLNTWFLFEKGFKLWVKGIASFISIVIILTLSIGLFYIERTYHFMDKIKYRGYVTEKYYIITNNESNYYNIDELKDKVVGTYNEHLELYDEVIKQYKELVNSNLKEYEDVDTMSRDLIKKEIDAIIISEAHKETMDSDLEGFKDSVKTLYEIDIKVKKENVLKHPDINVKDEVFTIFLAGSDSRGDISKRSNCDVNMLITVNPNTYEILMVSIPRDYYVQLHGTTGSKDKLTHAGYYGVDMSINTIQDFMNIKIDYYVKVGFNTVIKLVDMIGGVDVYSDQGFVPLNYKHLYIKKGTNHMNGEMALAFARERYAYSTGDRHRIQNQQDVLSAVIKKMTNAEELLTKYTSILNALADCLETNFSSKEITSLLNLQLDKMPKWNIKTYNLNGYDSSGYTYSYGNKSKLWVMEPNYETVTVASGYINGMRKRKSFSELGIE